MRISINVVILVPESKNHHTTMITPLTAISPVDGRYRNKTEKLADYFSEAALIRYRIRVEIEYFIALCELTLPLVKVGGQFAAMKSVSTDEEIRQARSAIAQLGGQLSGVTDYTVPETDVVHRIVSIEKTQHTPKQFPRAFARIKKAPLV